MGNKKRRELAVLVLFFFGAASSFIAQSCYADQSSSSSSSSSASPSSTPSAKSSIKGALAPWVKKWPAVQLGHKSKYFWLPITDKPSDPHSLTVSKDALQLAEILGISGHLARIAELYEEISNRTAAPAGQRSELTDLKVEVLGVLEDARLQIDFVSAEIEEEQAACEEVLQAYKTERDNRALQATLWSLRLNGVLWAVAEALSIPTVNRPHYAVSAGTIGILAGLVPTAFSIYAIDRGGGKSKHERKAYPNMLAKIYSLPTIPRTEYPDAVWKYLCEPPVNDDRERKRILTDHWLGDRNIHSFSKGSSEKILRQLAGVDQSKISLDLLEDRLIMLREVKSVVQQMARPLLELSMVSLHRKTFTTNPNATVPEEANPHPEIAPERKRKSEDRDGKDRDGKDRDSKDRDSKDRDGKDRDGKEPSDSENNQS